MFGEPPPRGVEGKECPISLAAPPSTAMPRLLAARRGGEPAQASGGRQAPQRSAAARRGRGEAQRRGATTERDAAASLRNRRGESAPSTEVPGTEWPKKQPARARQAPSPGAHPLASR